MFFEVVIFLGTVMLAGAVVSAVRVWTTGICSLLSVWSSRNAVRSEYEPKLGVRNSLPYEAPYLSSLLEMTPPSFSVTVSEIPTANAVAALLVPSGLLRVTVVDAMDPVQKGILVFSHIGHYFQNVFSKRKVAPLSDQRGDLLFAYLGGLFQNMREVAFLVLRRERGICYHLPLTDESLRTELLHIRSGQGSFELNLNGLYYGDRSYGGRTADNFAFWKGLGVSLAFELMQTTAADEPSEAPEEGGGVQAVLALKVHEVLATRLLVSVLGSPAGDLLQPSDVGGSAMIPLDDVYTDRIAFWLLDYDEESISERYSLVAAALINATDLANGKKRIVVASNESKYTIVVSTKLH